MKSFKSWWSRLMLCVACMVFVVGLVGCDTAKPEKFAGFASEQLSEQIESVSAKLDESIEENHLAQVELLRAVRDLSETVAGMQLTSQKQIEELKKVSGKAKVKLTSSGDEKEGVSTLDPNGAPSAKLQLDSLDDAAAQIEALVKRIDELEKRCNSFASAAPSSGGGSSGSLKSGGSTGKPLASSYQAPPYQTPSAPTAQITMYTRDNCLWCAKWMNSEYGKLLAQGIEVAIVYDETGTVPRFAVSDGRNYTGFTSAETLTQQQQLPQQQPPQQSQSQNQQYRTGLLGRVVPVRRIGK